MKFKISRIEKVIKNGVEINEKKTEKEQKKLMKLRAVSLRSIKLINFYPERTGKRIN